MKKHLYVVGCALAVWLTAGSMSEAGCRNCSRNNSSSPREQVQPPPQVQPQRQIFQPQPNAQVLQPRGRQPIQQSYQRQPAWPRDQFRSTRAMPGWNTSRMNRMGAPNMPRSRYPGQPDYAARQPGYGPSSRSPNYPPPRDPSATLGAPRLVHIDRATDLRVTPGSRTVTAVRREPNGSQLFLESHVQQNGLRRMTAYRITRNASAGTMSRLYMDGRKVTVGRDFVLRSQPRHLTVVTRGNGLREASLPNGRPVFRDRFETVADARGHRAVVRTVYARVHDGRAWALRHPVTQVFHLVPFHGADLYVYQPWAPPVGFYEPFVAAIPAPLPPVIACPACMDSGEVAFADAPEPYTDPGAMLADNVIAGGIHDGVNGSQDDVSPPDAEDDANVPPVALGNSDPDPELAKMAVDSSQLETQLASTQAQDADLSGSSSPKRPAQSDAQHSGPVRVSSEVRDQVRKQVKYDVSLQKTGQPLSLDNVLQSKSPGNYIFQVSEMISTADISAGDECVLSTGDLIRFDQIPGESDPVARMRVITSKDGSCQAGTVVQIGLSDLQNMLNGFSQRLEMAMRDTHNKVATTAPRSAVKGG